MPTESNITAAEVLRRAPRRDAAANRARLVAAASVVFGEHGTDASLEQVASTAGLGMATLYRRFPTKESLIAEAVEAIIGHVVAVARAETASTDGLGFERWLWTYADIQSRNRGLVAHLWARDMGTEGLQDELRDLIGELLDEAKTECRIRQDVAVSDVVLIILALGGIAQSLAYEEPASWRRHLALVLAGLRPSTTDLSEPEWQQHSHSPG